MKKKKSPEIPMNRNQPHGVVVDASTDEIGNGRRPLVGAPGHRHHPCAGDHPMAEARWLRGCGGRDEHYPTSETGCQSIDPIAENVGC